MVICVNLNIANQFVNIFSRENAALVMLANLDTCIDRAFILIRDSAHMAQNAKIAMYIENYVKIICMDFVLRDLLVINPIQILFQKMI